MIFLKMAKINRITAIYFISLLFLYRFVSLPNIFFIIAIICYVFIPAYGSMKICSDFYVNAICSIVDKNSVILSFNLDKPEVDPTELLNCLDDYTVKGMFFVSGQYVKAKPEWVKLVKNRGHILGNHYFYNSKNYGFDRPSKLVVNLNETSKLITNITNEAVVYFRPPFGITNPFVKKAVTKLDLNVIGWQIKLSLKKLRKDRSTKKIIRKLRGGEIILVDMPDYGNIERILFLIEEIKKRDLSFRLLD